MPKLQLSELLSLTKIEQILRLSEVNAELEALTAQERILWALENLEGNPAVSSSFGIQAAVMLQLVTDAKADTPVILTDTGYLFPETYQFVDLLTERLKLNLHVFTAQESPNWQEARYGKLWEKGVEGIEQYNKLNKVQPMRRALDQLEVGVWFSGLRREQSSSRANLPVLSIQNGVFKFLPVLDWSNKDVHHFLEERNLPYHPLRDDGYLSVGDTHTTQKWEPGMKEEETRFFGLKRECGLHEDDGETAGSGI
ncbi:phosphoadenylyl-sulfate reductase [Aliivibrio sp. S4TY2]|uniref:phosphoadenylyl-sulfate reductase n=1 Tax=unclassified Aliivibrio TaxID=2645654 RepID=UPI0023783FD8|nr:MULTISPECIES: phosphoadenylyl-sulfate reductase [unclassified Aliivibrio]MDD9157649.1 phosphoadenylyl-sulfate reductase [Aliivibrio sp. S4TY2]MDD9161673.1 phosphoadenylyl-sulfate reductase [Aliivibrio sp. S4TY1]MDD9165650.1 phosphoadenylyl-sulfate reductase [Aliivibrio sp. S4MY2]MDD9169649.1 phosphoadenylyl-sulfate reductase [Aliivibrio sp. S4MY4]MDD9186695.1 phosphoadenylyl-sulfate reductase [Aliivibrio sp. S4MY3]